MGGGPVHLLDGAAVARWAVVIRSALASRRAEIDALNVFPVPDGDTGTNLYLTFDGALERTMGQGDVAGAGELLTELARSLLWTARGNSGVILSQLVRGFAEGCEGAEAIDAPTLGRALAQADERAWQGVTDPKEGTILSVSRAAAQAAAQAVADQSDADLHVVVARVCDAARRALARTPEQLPVLARAGVVDAGGAGLVVILEALERVCAGDDDSVRPEVNAVERRRDVLAAEPAPDTPEFEVMYLLADSTEEEVATLRAALVALGDSVLVVGGDGLWNIHAHVDDAGAAVEAGLLAGRPHRIRITSLLGGAEAGHLADHGHGRLRAGGSGVVACTAGEGIAEVFRRAGAVVVPSGPGHRASTGQLIDAIAEQHRSGVSGVIVLPNDVDTGLAAAAAVQAALDEGIEAHLVQARTAVQGIAALAVFDPAQPAAGNALAMQGAASATRHGAVTVSNREALTSGGYCRPGDILGIVDGDIVIVGSDQEAVGVEVVHRLLSSGGELLTIVSGAEAPDGLVDAISGAGREAAIGLEVTHIPGGQPIYSVFIGVE